MTALPVAGTAAVRRATVALVRRDPRGFALLLALNALAALAALVGPWLLGRIIDRVSAGAGTAAVDRLALAILAAAVAQLLLSRQARYAAHRFGERTSARIREQFVDRALALPPATVERAGTGDLTTRGTADVAAVGTALRDAAPDVFIALVEVLLIVGALLTVQPLLGLCGAVGMAGIWFGARWYLRHARDAYLAEGAATSRLAEVIATTATGARTVEALGLQRSRTAAGDTAVEDCRRTRERTLFLRNVFFPTVSVSYVLPLVAVLLAGSVLHSHGLVSVGAAVAAAMYVRQLVNPLDTIVVWIEQLQSSGASYARVEGLADVPQETGPDAGEPADDRIEVGAVRYAYDGHGDVLHGVDLTVRPGERLAVVGPSGSGKTTLARLLAGMDRPRDGAVTVGGVPIADLGPERLRRQVVLVTQEHHVFLGTLRDNLRIAAPDADDAALDAALAAVGWQLELPDGLDTELGAGGHHLDGAHSQQLALARVVLADPHTLVLDEATALLDPRTARTTERALAAVLEGRTVIAIAHRLHTAHDADRVAVMQHGHLTELGTHDELVNADGPYAALWHTWRSNQPGARGTARPTP